MTPPNIASMLPAVAREALLTYFLAKLESSPLNYRHNSTFTEVDARGHARDLYGYGWAYETAVEQYYKALEQYERMYPLTQDKVTP